ncbi:hypothetical protein B0H11DRAFT_2290139 [Mycena galericulata]|nr:hypothetical protein B0H11DRAFT_2290139 [Mycena galericulata]
MSNSDLMTCLAAVRGRLQCLEQLRFDTYGGGDLEKKSSVPRIPVSQIQSLTISYNCLPFAAKLPNLISLSCTTPASHSGPPVSLVSLPSLTIHPTVMRSVTTPSLTQLHLISKDGAVCSPPQFASFVTRNHFSLHALILENVLIHANDLLDILPLVPTLQVLTLVTLRPNALTDRLMRTLAISVGSFEPQLLPTLTKLSVVGGYLFSNTTLLDMLESRASESAGRVRHVRLHLTQRQFKDEELDRLRALGRRGVWLAVECVNAEKHTRQSLALFLDLLLDGSAGKFAMLTPLASHSDLPPFPLHTMEESASNPSPLPPIISASGLRSRLVELDEEMHLLQSRLRLLGAQRQIVLQALDNITYPVLTIPPEITGQVFSFYVENPHIGIAPDDPGRSPLPLASVCRRWRDICLSMPRLWSALRIYSTYSASESNIFDLLQRWISRAGSHPLDLELSGSPILSTPAAILSHLAHYSHQWRILRLSFHLPSSFPNDKIQGRVPCLTKLTINIIGGYDVPEMVTAFRDAPRLRDVQLFGASFRSLSLPWIQLTSLNFSGGTLSNCVEILEQTPNLELLSVHLLTKTRIGKPPLTLLHLHTLVFQCDHAIMLLDYLTLPALKTFELSALESDGVLALATRSQWSLRSIRLVALPSPASVLCLASTPSVEEVEIRHSAAIFWWHDSLDKLISLLRKDDAFLPNALVLKLTHCIAHVSASSLAKMLTSRRNESREGIAKLETFHLLFEPGKVPRKYLEEIVRRMRPLQDMGLDIVVGESADD